MTFEIMRLSAITVLSLESMEIVSNFKYVKLVGEKIENSPSFEGVSWVFVYKHEWELYNIMQWNVANPDEWSTNWI